MIKKHIILLILCLAFSYVKAQNILINGTTVSVSQDVTFPFWLDSMSTVEIGSQVVSISALEFNIVPTTNGNSLVFVQTKIITSQQTVPNGKTWKLEGVLLDSTATNTTTSSGGITVVSGGEKAVALSEQSASTMNLSEAMLYCDSLVEGGYDNWVVPNIEELMSVAGGGGLVPGTRSVNNLWTITLNKKYNDEHYFKTNLNDVNWSAVQYYSSQFVRCVRHESISVSSSNGSSTPSTLGSGMPTMISTESDSTMYFSQAMLYCDTLLENGFSDWVLPTIDQLSYAASGGCVIDVRTSNYIWSRSLNPNTNNECIILRLNYFGSGGNNSGSSITSTYNYIYYQWDNETAKGKSRCVR